MCSVTSSRAFFSTNKRQPYADPGSNEFLLHSCATIETPTVRSCPNNPRTSKRIKVDSLPQGDGDSGLHLCQRPRTSSLVYQTWTYIFPSPFALQLAAAAAPRVNLSQLIGPFRCTKYPSTQSLRLLPYSHSNSLSFFCRESRSRWIHKFCNT